MNKNNNEQKHTLTIRLDNSHTAFSNDGRQFQLTTGSKKKPVWITGLVNLNRTIEAKGIKKPWELQAYLESSKVIREALGTTMAILDRYQNKRHLEASFGNGAFRLLWTPLSSHGAGSQWTLVNPGHTIARLPETSGNVGYYASAMQAVWVAVERTLLASGETIEYTDLADRALAMTKSLVVDLKVERTTK